MEEWQPPKAGDVLTKPNWTSCAVAVLDVGRFYFFGRLFDHDEKIFLGEVVGRLNDREWQKVETQEPQIILSTDN